MSSAQRPPADSRLSPTRQLIPPESWTSALDSFSRQHERWLVSVTTCTPDGRTEVMARELPLLGVSPASHESHDLAVHLGTADAHFTHDVNDAVALNLELTDKGVERALTIEAKDGSTTTIEFRSPMRPEEVDGLPPPRST